MQLDSRWAGFVRSLEVFTNEEAVQLNVLESERPVARRFFEWCAEKVPGYVPGALDYAAGDAIQFVNHFRAKSTRNALIHKRRIREAIAQHNLPRCECGKNGLFDILRPRCKHQQKLSCWADFFVLRVK